MGYKRITTSVCLPVHLYTFHLMEIVQHNNLHIKPHQCNPSKTFKGFWWNCIRMLGIICRLHERIWLSSGTPKWGYPSYGLCLTPAEGILSVSLLTVTLFFHRFVCLDRTYHGILVSVHWSVCLLFSLCSIIQEWGHQFLWNLGQFFISFDLSSLVIFINKFLVKICLILLFSWIKN